MKKYFRLLLALALTLSSLSSPASERPILDKPRGEVTPLPSHGGYTGNDGKFRCTWGCGPYRSPEGEGWGYGEHSGKGDSPSLEDNTGSSNGSSSGSGEHNTAPSGGASSESGSSKGDRYFRGFDRYNGEKKEPEAWKEYNGQVGKFNEQWNEELTQRYKTENEGLSKSEIAIEPIASSNSNELIINPQSKKDIGTLISESVPIQIDGYRYLLNDRTELKPFLEYEYQSDHKSELDKLREPLLNFKPNSPQSYSAFKAGLSALKRADESYLQNEVQIGDFLKAAAKTLLDVATDLIPIYSIPKDLYRTFVGKDPFSGHKLTPFERVLAGGFVVLAVGTVGISNFAKGIKEVEVIAEASAREAAEAESYRCCR